MAFNLCALQDILEYALSGKAVFIYIIIFFVVLVVLIVSFIVSDFKSGGTAKNGTDNVTKLVLSSPVTVDKPEDKDDDYIEDENDGEDGIRFPQLCLIDAKKETYNQKDYDYKISLKEFCYLFRDYAAGELELYYSIKDIRQFIAGMAVSKIIILQGMSGTGKTSLATAFGRFVDRKSTIIAVQPMWKERTDLIGYFNEFTKKFSEQDLLIKMYEANYSKDMYVTVLDEMNIARVEYYFAEFLSLLEQPKEKDRYLSVIPKKWDTDPELITQEGKIKIPSNMWYVGTANNDDSTFAISDKVYDRAMIMDLDTKAEPFRADRVQNVHITAEYFYELAAKAQTEFKMTGRNRKRLAELDRYMIEKFRITFGNRIMKQIETYIPIYVSCGGTELDALDEILSKKVMRKLSMQNPIQVRNLSEEFIHKIEDLFGEGNMTMCKDSIIRIANNA